VLFEALRPYRDIIRGVHVDRFRSIETAHELRGRVLLRDGSVLHIRDYLFRDRTRKYAYHWQTATGRLRRRWDNSGHWPEIASHPHHVQVGSAKNVQASSVRDLAGVLAAIGAELRRR